MTANVQKLIDRVIGVEGGYVNHPSDRGGPTRWGISEQIARAYGYLGDMRNLPRPVAVEIFRKRFWDEPGISRIAELAPDLAAELFDTGVNMGASIPGQFVQRGLNVLNRRGRDYPDIGVDGRIGTMTIAALKGLLKARGALGEKVLIKICEGLQCARYVAIAEGRESQEDFAFGWVANRIGENLGGSL